MKAIYTLFFILFAVSSAYTQNSDSVSRDTVSDDQKIFITDEPPKFPGGNDKMMKFLKKNLVYPSEAKKKKIEARAYVKFIVEKDGSITHIELLKPIDPLLTAEAIRLVSIFPTWVPGKKDGKAVRSQALLPIIFNID